MIPVTILTGFLGSGKTTLLKRILNEKHGMKIAVIENEFGEENIDNEILVQETNEQIIQMSNGCICCTIRGDLARALEDLADRKKAGTLDFDRVVIETTGLANPGPVAQTFFMDNTIADEFLLDAIITLVDAKHANHQLDEHEVVQRQVGFADRLFITKSDLVDAAALDDLKHRLRAHEPAGGDQGREFRRRRHQGNLRPARLQPELEAGNRPGFPGRGRPRSRPCARTTTTTRTTTITTTRPAATTTATTTSSHASPSRAPRRQDQVVRLPQR